MEELMLKEQNIKTMIYEIRGKQVMLDSDLARLYGYSQGTKALNQAVKRNIERFPEDFYFQLTKHENIYLRSQTVTANKNDNMSRTFPYAFTEKGVAMLSSILKTKNAALVNIQIMRSFVSMRHYLLENQSVYQNLNNINNELHSHKQILIEHEEKFHELFSNFKIENLKEKIYFNGEIYDAYSKLIDLMKNAKEELIIIDSYADKSVLDMISQIKIKVILITKTKSILKKIDIDKYNKQYHNLTIIYNDTFHDRFLILDKKTIYHLGTSLNHAGNKTFLVNCLEEEDIKALLINKIKNLK